MDDKTYKNIVNLCVATACLFFGINFLELANWLLQVDVVFEFIVFLRSLELSIIIAFVAFIAAVCQALAARTQNRRSVQPFLISAYDKSDRNWPALYLKNVGNGPAIIVDFFIRYEGKEYRSEEIYKLLYSLVHKKYGVGFECYYFLPNGALGAGESRFLLEIETPLYSEITSEIFKYVDDNVRLIIKYKSLLGEEFPYDTDIHEFLERS